MKKIFILFATSMLSIGAFAQKQVPNGGFENWNDSINPIGWNTYASPTAFGPQYCRFAVKDTSAQAHIAGSVTLRMKTDTASPQGITRSYVGLGTIAVAGAPTFTGTAFNGRPDTLFLSYVYFSGAGPQGADSALVQIDLQKAGTSIFTGGVHTFYLPPTNFTMAAFPLTSLYSSTDTPDLLKIVFKSSKSAAGAEFGSTLYLDEVHFNDTVAVVNGINDINAGAAVSAYPNPANSTVNIVVAQNEVGSAIQLIDLAGREVYNGTLSSTSTAIDTRNLESGIYAIRIASNDHLTIFKGKISIAH
jgi:hypothetical protein